MIKWWRNCKNISYILQFIYSTRSMGSSLSNLINNISEGIRKIKCKYGHVDKKCEICRIKYKCCDCFLEYTNSKDDLIEYKCLYYNKSYHQKCDEKLKERFFDTYKFSNHDNNTFILLLQKLFILMNICMIGKKLRKHHYLKMKIFIAKILLMQIRHLQNEFVKILK